MSKIVPKLTQSQSSQSITSNQSRNENTESEVMFAALFGGAGVDTPSEEPLIGKLSMVTVMSADTGNENSLGDQTNDDLMALIASLHGGRGLGQKLDGLQGDNSKDELELEKGTTSPDSENSHALALATSGTLFPEIQGGTTAMPKSAMAGLANMVFEDEVGPNARTGTAAANFASKNPAPVDGGSLLGHNKSLLGHDNASKEFIAPQQVQQVGVKKVENLAVNMHDPLTKKMTSDVNKLQASRAANLEQQNVDIDNEAAKVNLEELNEKLGKNGQTTTGQKQMMLSTFKTPLTVKVALLGEEGRVTNDVTRLATASSTALDNAPAITGAGATGSSTGQSGGQTGHHGGSQAGSQSAGGLLGNLNNLQILDTAKDNWTEMLLQRVKSGLSGGKDQLDFQLNPRNLGKMRISLVMHNDRTNIQIQTETSAAASMLSESESRLAQMLEASGLRLGNLNSGQFQGFGGTGSDQNANQQGQNKTGSPNQPDELQGEGEVADGLVNEGSDNLINIQA